MTIATEKIIHNTEFCNEIHVIPGILCILAKILDNFFLWNHCLPLLNEDVITKREDLIHSWIMLC